MAKQDVFKGFVLGIAAAVLVPVVRSALGERGESLGRAAARAGAVLGEKAREIAAELGEIAEDTVAELQSMDGPDIQESAAEESGTGPAEATVESRTA